MMDYEYLFSNSLYEALKSKVKGRVFCEVKDDSLHIQIQTREIGIFERNIDDFSHKLITGTLSTEKVAADIVTGYYIFIKRRFFN